MSRFDVCRELTREERIDFTQVPYCGVRLHELGAVLPEVDPRPSGGDLSDPGAAKPRHVADNMMAGVGRLPDEKTRRRMLEFLGV
jgi:hypothetical protein